MRENHHPAAACASIDNTIDTATGKSKYSQQTDQEIFENLLNDNRKRIQRSGSFSSRFNFQNDNDDDEDEDEIDDNPLLALSKIEDIIEDEIDIHTNDLLPIELRLWIEQNVFGWSHLLSGILGYTLHMGINAFLAYQVMNLCLLKEGAWNWWHVVQTWMRCRNDVDDVRNGTCSYDLTATTLTPKWGMTFGLFTFLRGCVTVISVILTFRTVRRRRRIWLHSAYGTRGYRRDEVRRRNEVLKIDKLRLNFKIGIYRRGRDAWRARQIRRKLRKARKRFEHKDRNKSLRRVETWTGSFTKKQPVQRQRTMSDDENPYLKPLSDDNQRGIQAASTFEDEEDETTITVVRENIQVHSVTDDQIPIAEIDSIPYAHGGFFGAAPFMLGDPRWIDILRELMPDVYVEVARRIFFPTPKLIHWAENNPVVAAYGTVHEHCVHGKMTTMEWDVFVNPVLVRKLGRVLYMLDDVQSGNEEVISKFPSNISKSKMVSIIQKEVRRQSLQLLSKMLIAHGTLTQLTLEQLGILKKYNFSRIKRSRRTLGGGIYAKQWLAVYSQALKLGIFSGDDDNNNSDDEGKPDDGTLNERFRSFQIAQRRKIMEANRLSINNPFDIVSSCVIQTMKGSIDIIKRVMGEPPGFILDLKSRHVPKRVWALLVDELRNCGAHVEGLASFTIDEIRDISKHCSLPVREVIFFHSAGDMQYACHRGKIQRGDCLYFNAGSLLWDRPREWHAKWGKAKHVIRLALEKYDQNVAKSRYQFQPYARFKGRNGLKNQSTHKNQNFNTDACETQPLVSALNGDGASALSDIESTLISTIRDYKLHYNLSIGLYCQEFSIDEAAMDMIVKYVNDRLDVFDLGLSWGGLNGVTVGGIQPGRFTSTDGFWNQRYLGISWNTDVGPADDLDPDIIDSFFFGARSGDLDVLCPLPMKSFISNVEKEMIPISQPPPKAKKNQNE